MSKVLVTGASGFTGKALCRKLVENGAQVVAFVRATSKIAELKALSVECRQIDITNLSEVQDNFVGINQVYHLAAAYRTEHADQEVFRRVNVDATRNLLEAAKAAKVKRFVHCSTVGVQGHIDDPPAGEDYRFNPGDHYQQTKVEGEILALKYFETGLPGSVVRPSGIYGPGDTRFLKLFRPINRGYFIMIGSGQARYHMTYIDDLIQGILLCGHKPEATGSVFTIAGEECTTIEELVNKIADVLGKPRPKMRVPFFPVYALSFVCEKLCKPLGVVPPLYPRRVEFFHKDRAFSIEKAKRLLGYKPKVGLREGLTATANWYKEQGLI